MVRTMVWTMVVTLHGCCPVEVAKLDWHLAVAGRLRLLEVRLLLVAVVLEVLIEVVEHVVLRPLRPHRHLRHQFALHSRPQQLTSTVKHDNIGEALEARDVWELLVFYHLGVALQSHLVAYLHNALPRLVGALSQEHY
mmetsp:Transcript_22640/g.21814  ORF Transcript_22640/g.21814 Transcript_22640/m.21814 type:complete len:138 (-) Transcript_22640:67-480(-)